MSTLSLLGMQFCSWSSPVTVDMTGDCQRSAVSSVIQSAQDGSVIADASVRITALFLVGKSTRNRDILIRSGPDGRFGIPCLDVGSYALEVSATGFVTQHATLALNEGPDVISPIRLKPATSIDGTVADSDGRPVSNVLIKAWIEILRRGTREYEFAGEARSDASGAFTMRSLRSGTYILQTTAALDDAQACAFCGFYPSSYLSGESEIRVNTPALGGVKLTLAEPALYSVRGHVVDPNEDTMSNISIQLVPCIEDRCIDSLTESVLLDRSGAFAFGRIPRGRYRIMIVRNGRDLSSTDFSSKFFNVYASDIDDLTLPLCYEVLIGGRISLHDDSSSKDLRRPSRVRLIPNSAKMTEQVAVVGADGEFSFNSVPQGSYRIGLDLAAGTYMDTLSLNNQPVSSSQLEVESSSRLDMTLSSNGGAIIAKISDEEGRSSPPATSTPPSAMGILYPVRDGVPVIDAVSLRPAINGIISIPDLRPGSYFLFVVLHCDLDLWQCRDFVARIASRATDMSVRGNSQATATISVLSDQVVLNVAQELGVVTPLF